jgi:Fic family protein
VELYRAKERALIAQLIIDLLKTAHAAHQRFTGKAKPYLTSDVESLLLGWAVLLGHVSGRPRNASEIARYLGVPRVTAKRKLDALEKGGIIVRRGSKYHMAHVELGGDDYVDRCMSLIKRAAQL